MSADADDGLVAAFIDYLKVEKGLAALSVAAYARDLKQLHTFLRSGRRTLLDCRRDDVRAFLDRLFSAQVDGRSVSRTLSATRQFYRFMLLDRLIQHVPSI